MKCDRFLIIIMTLLALLLATPNVTSAADLCFESPVTYPSGDGSFGVIAADLDGDIHNDLAVANWYSGDLSVLLNNGDGTFATAVNYPISTCANSVCAADLNDNGYKDLVVTSDRFLSNVAVLMNNGDGTFMDAVFYTSSKGPASVTADDMDRDGDIDLVVANEGGENVSVLNNNGDGTFSEAVNYAAGNNPYWHCTGDFDQDGDSDVAVANIDGHDVSILMNAGDGSLEPKISYPANSTPNFISCADLDHDDDIDLMVTNGKAGITSILMNEGDGTFAAPISYAVGLDPSSVQPVDLDLDGNVDLAVTIASDSISILMNSGGGEFSLPSCYAIGDNPRSLCVSDIDNDNDSDLIAALFSEGSVAILRNCQLEPLIHISLDIKPGSCPNPLNLNFTAHGQTEVVSGSNMAAKADPGVRTPKPVLPVAILGTDDFDAADIDPASVMLEGVPAVRWAIEDVSTPVGDDAAACECTDAGPDGFADLTVKFYRIDIVSSLDEVQDGDTVTLTLTGELYDGTPIQGFDCVIINGNTAERSIQSEQTIPEHFFTACFPNPFNPATEISFALPEASHLKLDIYNVMGRKVSTLVNEHRDAGHHTVRWDGSVAASGVYFYRIEAGSFVESKKMILLK